MLKSLWDMRFTIVVIVAFVFYCLMNWKEAKSRLYALMLQAKRQAKDAVLKSGQEQEEWVVKKAYQFLPVSFRVFISEPVMRWIVHWLYKKGKDYLDDGKLNSSI